MLTWLFTHHSLTTTPHPPPPPPPLEQCRIDFDSMQFGSLGDEIPLQNRRRPFDVGYIILTSPNPSYAILISLRYSDRRRIDISTRCSSAILAGSFDIMGSIMELVSWRLPCKILEYLNKIQPGYWHPYKKKTNTFNILQLYLKWSVRYRFDL